MEIQQCPSPFAICKSPEQKKNLKNALDKKFTGYTFPTSDSLGRERYFRNKKLAEDEISGLQLATRFYKNRSGGEARGYISASMATLAR